MSRVCDLLSVGVMSGNKVSHSNRKTRRRFVPNLKSLSFKSEALGVNLSFSVAASTARTINKYGGIDGFLINYRFNKLSAVAQKVRRQITKSLIKADKLSEVKVQKTPKAKAA